LEAEAAYRKALALQPASKTYYNLGNVLSVRKKPAEAEAAYRKAIALQPDFALAYNNLGLVLFAQKKLPAAEAAHRKAIELQPDDSNAYYNLGNVLRNQTKPAEAEAAFRKAIALKPDDALAYTALSTVLGYQKKRGEAEAACRKAITLKPDLAEAHFALGLVLSNQNRLEEAEVAFRECLKIAPQDAAAHLFLGLVFRDQGRFTEAVASLRRGHVLGWQRPGWSYPSAQWVQQAQVLLRMDRRLTAVLQGQAKPANAAEQLIFAWLCAKPYKQRHASSARFYTEAFAADPNLANDLRRQHRYNAACSAALAAAGKGKDAATLDAKEQTRLRQQALSWLQADLTAHNRLADKGAARSAIRQRLAHWLEDADLADVRDAKSLADLPTGEREAWRKLWADVVALLHKAEDKK
jgi:tetratricopeptide (TPR) repeat protein